MRVKLVNIRTLLNRLFHDSCRSERDTSYVHSPCPQMMPAAAQGIVIHILAFRIVAILPLKKTEM